MTPIVPLSGYAGWRFISASLDTQVERYAASPVQARDRAYFRETIGTVTSAEALVADYRLRRVALSAFGLSDDMPNRAFVERVLSEGTVDDDALANKLADTRYRKFSEAFGFGSPLPPRTQSPGFADRILSRFDRQEFETAVGAQDEDMRLALNASREVPELAQSALGDTTAWLTVLGTPPLRSVFETALGLPASIATLDLDRQVDSFRTAAARVFGSPDFAQFTDPDKVEDLMRNFTLRAQISAGPPLTTPGYAAITLLSNMT
ncbi:Flagellar basal-body rod protein FlgF [Roseibacterium elongatum DSM 19469]|uniref:Flagellar basal-body rod protein FlgF n=1 Tax=Roseicyclus elongatus DSM 19469 TaxID=1294273 RepID=W8S0M2_9RHOB|nr:DUF1217 domain-containing protein [Roseibacterium elongatum]AHM03702.1 Flagellar basal-body rod protein FlgF [Roseibacterium elongatum DSM 19469]